MHPTWLNDSLPSPRCMCLCVSECMPVCVCLYIKYLTTSSVGAKSCRSRRETEISPTVYFFLPAHPTPIKASTLALPPSFLSPLFKHEFLDFPHSFHSSRTHSWVQSAPSPPSMKKKKKKRILNLNYISTKLKWLRNVDVPCAGPLLDFTGTNTLFPKHT